MVAGVSTTAAGQKLKVRSATLVSPAPQPSIATEPGTRDRMPEVGTTMPPVGQGTADRMPQAWPADQSPLDRGSRVVASQEHYSWKALQAPEPGIGTEMGEPKHMLGVVQKNKAPF